ncbi:two-component regulator propeller domain-containing protein [uncultured Dokdonia sp.]|uniref:ligand-binding sensor domain-containing protein n=1 Tax=uncultured Dokdonia sp. TaxID=575653 RepID=UPI00261FF418|nr:two-component regulator propeller domain-containing protein [uncultured Dokdonia sp.]
MLFEKFNYYVLFIVFFCSYTSLAQDHPYFENFTAIDGISSNEIYDITQDTKGYIWFATDRGLTRYDGITFERFTTSEGLPDNVIYNFFEQEDGAIWCSTLSNSIFYFKNATDGFHLYSHKDIIENSWEENLIINNITLKNNELLVDFLQVNGYIKLNPSKIITNELSHLRIKPQKENLQLNISKEHPSFSFVTKTKKDISKELYWSKTIERQSGKSVFSRVIEFPNHNKRVCFFGRNSFIIDSILDQINEIEIIENNNDTPIMAGKYDNNHFWVGYQYGGVKIINLEGVVQHHFLKNKSVTKIFRDHENGLWISTLNAGVFYSKQPDISYYKFDSYPIDLAKDDNDQLYISLHDGKILRKEKDIFSTFSTLINSYPAYVKYDKQKDKIIDSKYLNEKGILTVLGINDDKFFTIPYERSNLFIFKNESYRRVNMARRIFDVTQKDSTIIIGTLDGLFKFENGSIYSLQNQHPNFSYRISDVDYKDQNLYISTMGAGILINKKDTIISISKKNGLSSDLCTELFVEDKYTIWAGTNQGLNRITLFANDSYEVETLATNEGLISSEINDIEVIKDTIWISSKEGLFSIPKKVVNQLTVNYKKWFQLNNIIVDEKAVDISEKLTFPYTTKSIRLEYKSISFKEGKETFYRYKIKKSDTVWKYSKRQALDILNIATGKYDISIQVKNDDGTWGDTIQTIFTITPPFWKSIWFLISSIIFLFILVYLAFFYRVLIFDAKYLKKVIKIALYSIKKKDNKTTVVTIKHDGKSIKVKSSDIGYFKSSRNYIEVYTKSKKYLIRKKIDDFYDELPDTIEYIKVHRSYYVRIDKVNQKNGQKEVTVFNTTIPVSKTYNENLKFLKL